MPTKKRTKKMPPKSKAAAKGSKLRNFFSKLNPNSPKKKLLLFVVVFGLIAGGFYAYRSFAAKLTLTVSPQEMWLHDGARLVSEGSGEEKADTKVVFVPNKQNAGAGIKADEKLSTFLSENDGKLMRFCVHARAPKDAPVQMVNVSGGWQDRTIKKTGVYRTVCTGFNSLTKSRGHSLPEIRPYSSDGIYIKWVQMQVFEKSNNMIVVDASQMTGGTPVTQTINNKTNIVARKLTSEISGSAWLTNINGDAYSGSWKVCVDAYDTSHKDSIIQGHVGALKRGGIFGPIKLNSFDSWYEVAGIGSSNPQNPDDRWGVYIKSKNDKYNKNIEIRYIAFIKDAKSKCPS